MRYKSEKWQTAVKEDQEEATTSYIQWWLKKREISMDIDKKNKKLLRLS